MKGANLEESSSFLRRRVSLRAAMLIWLVTLILLATYTAYVEPFREALGDDIYLDLKLGGYDIAEVNAFLESIGPEWRAFYVRSTVFDTIWPLGIALSGFLLAPWGLNGNRKILLGMFFPVAFGVLDLFENIGILTMLANYPDISTALVAYSNACTVSKQLMIPGAFAASLALLVLALWRRRRE